MATEVTYPDVTVRLTGGDGNAFFVMAKVKKAIAQAHGEEAAVAWRAEALESGSYDALLCFCMDSVNVQ